MVDGVKCIICIICWENNLNWTLGSLIIYKLLIRDLNLRVRVHSDVYSRFREGIGHQCQSSLNSEFKFYILDALL